MREIVVTRRHRGRDGCSRSRFLESGHPIAVHETVHATDGGAVRGRHSLHHFSFHEMLLTAQKLLLLLLRHGNRRGRRFCA